MLTGTAYVIEQLGKTLAFYEERLAERDAALEQANERIATLEATLAAATPPSVAL